MVPPRVFPCRRRRRVDDAPSAVCRARKTRGSLDSRHRPTVRRRAGARSGLLPSAAKLGRKISGSCSSSWFRAKGGKPAWRGRSRSRGPRGWQRSDVSVLGGAGDGRTVSRSPHGPFRGAPCTRAGCTAVGGLASLGPVPRRGHLGSDGLRRREPVGRESPCRRAKARASPGGRRKWSPRSSRGARSAAAPR